MPKYEIKKGHENRVFINSRRISETVVESDQPLSSPYLSLIPEAPMAPPAQPEAPITVAQQPTTTTNTETLNKESI